MATAKKRAAKPTAKQIAARKLFAQRAKAGAFAKNPAKRIRSTKAGLKKPSIATKAAPSARTVKRRKKTMSAPEGFYANPTKISRRKGPCEYAVEIMGKSIAHFEKLTDAKQYGAALADQRGKAVTIRKV